MQLPAADPCAGQAPLHVALPRRGRRLHDAQPRGGALGRAEREEVRRLQQRVAYAKRMMSAAQANLEAVMGTQEIHD